MIHFLRLLVPSASEPTTVEGPDHLEGHLDELLQSLAHAAVKILPFACASGSFIKGTQWDKYPIERMEKIITSATTTSDSVVSALKKLGVVKLTLVTPYPDPINDLMGAYLSSQGFHIENLKSLCLSGSSEIKRIPPKVIFDLAKSADTKGSEGILISCTDFQAVPIIEALELEVKKPVISSNQATFWKLMRLSGKSFPIKGYGQLLRNVHLR